MRGKLALVTIVLVAAFVAGCAAPKLSPSTSTTVSKDVPRPDVKAPKFAAPSLLGTIDLGSEPNVGVAKDGTVYVTTPLSVWRSDDAGKTFKGVGKASCFPADAACLASSNNPGLDGGGDGAIAVASSGDVYWAGLFGKTGSVPFQLSKDKAQSWSKGFDVAHGNSTDREWVVTNRSGAVFVSWRDFGNSSGQSCVDPLGLTCPSPPSGVLFAVSQDGGLTWSQPKKIVDDGHQGPLAPDPTSDWMFLPHVIHSNSLEVARSPDGGKTWENVKVAPLNADTFQFPIAAVDQAGTVYVTYVTGTIAPANDYQTDRFVNVPRAWLVTSADHGKTWTKPVGVSADGVPAVFPWIVAGAPGRVAITYYVGTNPTPMIAPNEWHVAVTTSTTADAAAPKFATSYVTATPNHVGQICVVGSGCGPQDRSLLDFFEIRALPDGRAVLAYVGDADAKMITVKVYAAVMSDGTRLWDS